MKTPLLSAHVQYSQLSNSIINKHKCTNMALIANWGSVYLEISDMKTWESLCSVWTAWIKNITRLTDTGPFFFSSVKVSVDWCEVAVVCLLPSVWDVWLDSKRLCSARRFPITVRCVKAESPPETQPCHLRHAAVSFPLTSSGSKMSLLFNSKRKHQFLKHLKMF